LLIELERKNLKFLEEKSILKACIVSILKLI